MDLAATIQGFTVENDVAKKAVALAVFHALRTVMEIFPPDWPLAEMTLPLKFCVQRGSAHC